MWKIHMTAQINFQAFWPDGVTKAVRVKIHVTAQSKFTHDGVRSGSRQYEFYLGGELTASQAKM
jgi:hypothetical protein